jgi:hypothetical protein
MPRIEGQLGVAGVEPVIVAELDVRKGSAGGKDENVVVAFSAEEGVVIV